MQAKTTEEDFFAYVANLKAENDLKYPNDVNTTEQAQVEFSVLVENMERKQNLQKKDEVDTIENVKMIDEETTIFVDTKEEPVDCTTSKTYKCTVDGPCFGKEFTGKQSLQKHMNRKHGDAVLAAQHAKHNNEMQAKRRKKGADKPKGK
jgi:hypothetical protein